MLLLMILSFAGLSLALFGGSIQSVAVTGNLVCNGKPVTDAKLRLYENGAIFYSLMEEGKSNQTGGFHISYTYTEHSTIDPVLYIYHKCDYGGSCHRQLRIEIPESFVSEGNTPKNPFDIGTINLASKFTNEGTDCSF